MNVILLLKGFYSTLCANGCPFPWRHKTMELSFCGLSGGIWAWPGISMKGHELESRPGILGRHSDYFNFRKN